MLYTGNVSPHFTYGELKCHCCDYNGTTQLLVNQLEVMRQMACDLFKKETPIIISCAYRCIAHNRKLGSKDNSFHVKGLAVDVVRIGEWTADDNHAEIISLASRAGFRALRSNGCVHCDLGNMIRR